jgi:putative alpha-1,2-mannosidase
MPFSKFSHDKEQASGYYTVDLLDYGIKLNLPATARTGIHIHSQKIRCPKSPLTQDMHNWDAPTKTHLSVVDDTTIEGYRMSTAK